MYSAYIIYFILYNPMFYHKDVIQMCAVHLSLIGSDKLHNILYKTEHLNGETEVIYSHLTFILR